MSINCLPCICGTNKVLLSESRLVYLSAVCYNYLRIWWACNLPTQGHDMNSNKIFLLHFLLRDTSALSLKKTKEGRVRNKWTCHVKMSLPPSLNLWQLLVHCGSYFKKSLVCLVSMLSHLLIIIQTLKTILNN